MNWDWEKLQEKRQRQGKEPSRKKPEEPSGNNSYNNNFDFNKYKSKLPSSFPLFFIIGAVVLIWLASGIFIVNPGEVGVVTRFGKFSRMVEDGPHYRLPYPFESREIVNTQLLRTAVIGQTSESVKFASQAKADESSMFTGDENIVHMHFNVQYSIDDAQKFLFKVKEPTSLVSIAAEAAMREVVGGRSIDAILTAARAEVQISAQKVLQDILNNYDSGIRIHAVQLLDVQPPAEVAEAFKDVASAREDRVTIINKAEAYRNEIVPIAHGTAQSLITAAEAYSQQVELGAQGEAERFVAMAKEYRKAKDITTKRIYFEAMQEILSTKNIEKIIISKSAKGGFLPFMNLDKNEANPSTPKGSVR